MKCQCCPTKGADDFSGRSLREVWEEVSRILRQEWVGSIKAYSREDLERLQVDPALSWWSRRGCHILLHPLPEPRFL